MLVCLQRSPAFVLLMSEGGFGTAQVIGAGGKMGRESERLVSGPRHWPFGVWPDQYSALQCSNIPIPGTNASRGGASFDRLAHMSFFATAVLFDWRCKGMYCQHRDLWGHD